MKILSLGWGVQSWTLAAMVALGELEPIDFAVHADTTWERKQTYDFASRWTPWLEAHGVKVVTVSDADQAKKAATAATDIPGFTLSQTGDRGQLRRQCTSRWKITPQRRFIAAELEQRGLAKSPGVVEQWLGISLDEWSRAKDADVKFIKHCFPLLDLRMTRGDCVAWLERNGLEVPGKSACVFCPYHNRRAWADMKRDQLEDWLIAVEIDLQIRGARPPYSLFVHSTRVPLTEAVNIPEDVGMTQPGMFDDECDSGHCFL